MLFSIRRHLDGKTNHLFTNKYDGFIEGHQRAEDGRSHRVRTLTGEETKTSGSRWAAKSFQSKSTVWARERCNNTLFKLYANIILQTVAAEKNKWRLRYIWRVGYNAKIKN